VPYHEQDICAGFDEMTAKQREAIDEISSQLKQKGFQTASFTAVMRKFKSKGGCDTHNPNKMLKEVLESAKSTYYIVVESEFQETGEGNYVNLNVSVYQADNDELITYESAQSDKEYISNERSLTRNAFLKIVDATANYLSPSFANTQATKPTTNEQKIKVNLISEVDFNLPKTRMQNPDAVAVVIGNANYTKTKTVDFALNDAFIVKKYLVEVLGFKEGNILYKEDALKSDFEVLFGVKDNPKGKLNNSIKQGKSDVFIFYSGHGAPGLKDKEGYFVPVDCDPQYIELGGYSTDVFYKNLAQIKAKSVTIVLDACFSGVELYENISPIRIKTKGILGVIDGVLLTSSFSDEVSCWYNEKGHGMFSYFFLKAIHQFNADFDEDKKLTFNEIHHYIADITEGLPYYARRLHGIEQNPTLQGNNTYKVWIEGDK